MPEYKQGGDTMGEWLATVITIFLFTVIPAYLLESEYNLAISLSFASISGILLSIFWNTNKLVEQGKH